MFTKIKTLNIEIIYVVTRKKHNFKNHKIEYFEEVEKKMQLILYEEAEQ